MSIKQKLLDAVGEVDVSDIGTEALVDILVSRIKAQDKKIKELHGENAAERQHLYDETERMHREIKEMRSNPMYGAYGSYCFTGGMPDVKFILHMRGGKIIEAIARHKTMDYLLNIQPYTEATVQE